MKILRILGYVAAFVVILVIITYALAFLLDSMGATWPPLLSRAVTVIVTWAIFWVAIWRPMGRRMDRARSAQPEKKQTPGPR
jgi:O-antigen/teichoic acid export membrane protein